MNKKVITTLEYNEDNFNTNTIIQSNGIIYSDYIACPSHSRPSKIVSTFDKLTGKTINIDESEILGPTHSAVYEKGKIIEFGFFIYNCLDLLKEFSYYGEKLYYIVNIDNYSNYIKDISKLKEMLNFDRNCINIDSTILEIIIDFFKEFGFPFNNKISTNLITNTFPYYLIESTVIPSLLLIYIVNTIYNDITFFETINLDGYDKEKLNEIANRLYSLASLFFSDVDIINFDNDENLFKDILSTYLEDYKINLLNIINEYSSIFSPINFHTYFNYALDKYTSIPISDNIFDLVWNICKDNILSNFGLLKTKKCLCCGKKLINKQIKYCSATCRKNKGGMNSTKINKKNFIIELFEKYKNYIFDDYSINEKLLEFKKLIDTKKIDNIDEHKYLIKKDLEPFRKKIEKAVLDKKYKMKK